MRHYEYCAAVLDYVLLYHSTAFHLRVGMRNFVQVCIETSANLHPNKYPPGQRKPTPSQAAMRQSKTPMHKHPHIHINAYAYTSTAVHQNTSTPIHQYTVSHVRY